jgi:hypothetical protein
MVTLTPTQRKTWKAILQDEEHPWYVLAEQAIKRDSEIKKIKRMFVKYGITSK